VVRVCLPLVLCDKDEGCVLRDMQPRLPDVIVVEEARVGLFVAWGRTLRERGDLAARMRARRNVGRSDGNRDRIRALRIQWVLSSGRVVQSTHGSPGDVLCHMVGKRSDCSAHLGGVCVVELVGLVHGSVERRWRAVADWHFRVER
jgi:hypothetical protein